MCSVVDHFPLAKLLCSHVCTFRVLITLIMSRDLITNINLTLIRTLVLQRSFTYV